MKLSTNAIAAPTRRISDPPIAPAPERRLSRRASASDLLLRLSGSSQRGELAAELWEKRSASADELMEDAKSTFRQHADEEKGTLSVGGVYSIMQEAFGCTQGGPDVNLVVLLCEAFAVNKPLELNMAEFLTLMRYMGEARESLAVVDDTAKKDADMHIKRTLKLYECAKKKIHDRLVEKLAHVNSFVKMDGLDTSTHSHRLHDSDAPFHSFWCPPEMRCLALVSHNGMKESMFAFVRTHQNVLKKFRLVGTNSTITMLQSFFGDDDSVVYGPSCCSGPLGGDAELSAMMAKGHIGGIIFFQDPMASHAHNSDIESLVRCSKIYNVMHGTNTVSAIMLMNQLRIGLEQGKPELLPSFFKSFECPSVQMYKEGQQKKLETLASSRISVQEITFECPIGYPIDDLNGYSSTQGRDGAGGSVECEDDEEGAGTYDEFLSILQS